MTKSAPPRLAPDLLDSISGLDVLLTDAALGPTRRIVPSVGVAVRCTAALAKRPRIVGRRAGALLGELAKVAVARSAVAPGKGDKRFVEPAWTGNPLLRISMQSYLAATAAAHQLVQDADLDWADNERARFNLGNLCDALAPSNNPALNPLMWKALVDSGGRSIVRGGRHLVADILHAPRVPSMVSPKAFTVGTDLAVSPGAVVCQRPVGTARRRP